MKKRIRKKHHLGEFDKFGIVLTFDVEEDKMNDLIDSVNDFADSHDLYAWGGGHGQISTQHVSDNYNVPHVVVTIIRSIMYGEVGESIFCFYSSKSQHIAKDVIDEMTATFMNSPYKAKIGVRQISLWHLR